LFISKLEESTALTLPSPTRGRGELLRLLQGEGKKAMAIPGRLFPCSGLINENPLFD